MSRLWNRHLLLLFFLIDPSWSFAQSHKGLTFQAFVKQPNGSPLSISGIPIQLQILSPNDCILYSETHNGMSVNNGYLNVVLGSGVRSSGDPGLAMNAVFNNKVTVPSLNSTSGGVGDCTYTPSVGGQDARRLRVYFQANADTIDANFNIRATAFAIESERLEGKSANEFIQTSPLLTQPLLENFFSTLTASTNKSVTWNGTSFTSYNPADGSSLTNVPWSSLTGVPSPLSGIAGLNCANNEILKWNGTAWTCAVDSAGVGTVTAVNAQAPLTSTGGAAPTIGLSAGSTAGQALRWDGSTWVAQKLDYSTDVVNSNSLSPWPTTSCAANEFLVWSSITDSFTCSGIPDATGTQKGLVQIGAGLSVAGGVVSLSTSGVTAGTYGSSTQIPQLQVDAQGRVVAVTNTAVNDTTKLPLSGGTLSGAIDMAGNNILYSGFITMNSGKSLHLSNNATDPVGLTAADKGKLWYNSTDNVVKYWDGTAAKTFIAKTCAAGQILKYDGSDWVCGTSDIGNSATLTNAKLWIGDGTNKAQEVSLSGDATVSNAGVLTLANSGVTAGTYSKVTVDAKGRVTVGANIGSSDVTTALGYTPLNKAGDVLGGPLGLNAVTSDPTGLTPADNGKVWYRSDTNEIKYWNGTAAVALGAAGSGMQSLNGLNGSAQSFATGTAGTDFGISSSGTVHTFNFPSASGSNRGLLTSTDWTTFNSKLSAVSNSANLADAKIWVGDGTGKAQEVSLSGDATVANTGALTIGAGTVTSGKILDGTVLGTDLNFTGVNTATSGIAVVDSTGKFFNFACATTGHVPTWTVSGFACQAPTPLLPSLSDGKIWIGDGTNAAVAQSMSGDATISNTGTVTVTNVRVDRVSSAAGQYLSYKPNDVSCANNEVLKWNGTGWICGTDNAGTGTVTGVTATSPLASSGGAAPVISISNGSTTGQTLRWDGSAWVAAQLSNSDVTGLGALATKNSVDLGTADATGTLAAGRMPALTGDVTSTAGSLTTTLANSGVTAGTYSKVTVDAKGRVTVGANIGSADVTTALGYTPLNKAGDVMTGTIGLGSYTNATEATLVAGYGAGDKGKTWFNTTTNQVKYWDGAGAQALGISGAGLTSLGGQTGSTQTFATGTSGTAPAWSSGSNTHTLNIPMASTAGTTAGLLSKSDYDAFNAKQAAGNYVTALTGDVTASGPGSAAATIAADAVTTGKILDGTVLGTDLNFTGVNTATSGIAVVDSTGKFYNFACATMGHVPTWTVSGFACQAPTPLLPSLASGKIWIGDGTNAAVAQTMSGDATISTAGALTLANSGVTAGTYSKVTVDAKGRVTVGANIGSSDVTTALGYTPLNKAGDVMSGLLGLSGVTSDPTGLVAADKGKVWYRTDTNEIKYWNGTAAVALGAAGSGLQSLNGLSGSTQTFATGTTGTDFNINSSGSAHTFNFPSASGANRGLLTSADWTAFNAKLDAVSNTANLANTKIWVGDGAGKAQEVSVSGDATISNTGAVTVNNVRVDRVSSAAGQYLSYKPNNVACANNEVLKWNGTSWICGVDNAGTGTVTGVTATAPLASSGGAAPVISISSGSTTGQALRWDGSAWVAAQLSNSDVTGLGALATKNSVDLGTADATGTLAAARMPALTGDVTSTAGSLATTLANSGVTAGTYSKVTVDAKGRVTAGANIGSSDVTTALGYTPLNKAGDVMTGTIGLGSYTNATEATLVSGYGAGDKGKTWFNTTTNQVKYWDGAAAQALGISGAGLTSLGGQTGSTQTFAIGTSGTAPAWSSSSNTHTLNIPMASTAGTTAGLLSKSDYDAFNAKQAAGNYVTALTGDVTASGPGSAAATIAANAVTTGKILDGTVLGTDLNYTGVNAGTSGIVIKDSTGKFFDFACGTAGHVATWTVSGWACQAPSPLLPSLASGKIWIGDGTNAAVAQTMSGDATISTAGALTLANSGVTAGTYSKVTVDAKGRVTTGANIASSDVTTALGYTPVNVAGDTMSGDLTFSGTKGIKLKDTSGPENVYIKSPGTLGASYTLTLPTAAPAAGQTLQSDASGNLSWTSSAGGVTSVTASTPLSSSGGATPNITISQANTTTDGYLSSTDWNTFNSKLGTSGGTMTGMLTLATGTTTLSPMRIPAGTLVTTPVSGNIESDGSNLYWTSSTPTRQKLASYTGTPANGQLLIGNGSEFSLANITAGSGITVTNSAGGITIASSGGGGSVTSVTSANTDISVATTTTTPVLTLNSGTGANQIVKLNGTSQLPAVDGSLLTSLNASNLGSGTVPAARMPALTGDVSMTAGTTTTSVDKIKAKSVVPVAYAAGQHLRYDGTNWVNALVALSTDITGTLAVANGGTGATTAAAARTNLGLGTAATQNTGSASGNVPLIGVSGITNNMMCTSDGTGSVICNTAIPSGSQWTTSGSNIYYNTGNVGIGTTSPTWLLSLSKSDSSVYASSSASANMPGPASGSVVVVQNSSATSGSAAYLDLWTRNAGSSSNHAYIGGISTNASYAPSIVFGTSTGASSYAERMRIDSAGNVGIGTSSPLAKLHLKTGNLSANNMSIIRLEATDPINGADASNYWIGYSDDEASGYTRMTFSAVDSIAGGGGYRFKGVAAAQDVVISANTGNVGLGTASPVSKLQVSGGSLTTAYSAISSLTVDFSTANVISTTAAAGTLVLNNMQNGTSYTLIVQNTGSYTLSGSSVSTWRCAPACSGGVISNTSGHVLITILKAGTTAYVSYISDM
ncbi:hypothetical protein [Bdellovibrio bacteriovorus]|uniref:hypothetical protein n=1 Tax=Bdellovibrio TaxID=958 RepID=UPI0035A9A059